MNKSLAPIETVYMGYKFRSRLEARWAVFFDAIGLEYQYELEGWDLGDEWYLPDFYLPKWDSWVEIKPMLPSPREFNRALKLRHKLIELKNPNTNHINQHVNIICGDPWKPELEFLRFGKWRIKQGYVILDPLGLSEKGETPNSAGVKNMRLDSSGSVVCSAEAFAMVNGGETLDIWPIYSGEIPENIAVYGVDELVNEIKEKMPSMKRYLTPHYPEGFGIHMYGGAGIHYDSDNLIQAYTAARQARFENR